MFGFEVFPLKNQTSMLVDGQSFYASCEKASHPEYANKPVVVSGDPKLRNGVVLAACPIAKKSGISPAEPLGEALNKCADLVVIRPRMQLYIDVSMQITRILERYSDAVEPWSIDEQFCGVTCSNPEETAKEIQKEIYVSTGVYTRVGLGQNKMRSKLALDLFSKKNKTGIYTLTDERIKSDLWRQPVEGMFGVGSRMRRHLNRLGIYTIGDLANYPVERLQKRWGINGLILHRTANGLDDSPITASTHEKAQKAIGHGMTLPKDYSLEEALVVAVELTEEVCRRCRRNGVMGKVLSVGCTGAGFEGGFSKQITMLQSTNVTNTVYGYVKELFKASWGGYPIRQLYIALGSLVRDDEYQLELFGDDREEQRKVERVTDAIKDRFGPASLVRAVSLTSAGQARSRAVRIGGHYK